METNQPPFFTVIVPLRELILPLLSQTLDSIVSQHFSAFEVLVVDAYPEDKRCDGLSSYGEKIAVLEGSGERDNLPLLISQGLQQARGEYVHILLPGEFYLSRRSFDFMRQFLKEESHPDLAYCGFISRYSFSAPQSVLRRICKRDLKGAKLSSSLQPYWFRKETLIGMGGFNPRYELQAGFDLICRFFESTSLKKAFLRRILTDQEYRKPCSTHVMRHAWETFRIICIYFKLNKPLLVWIARTQARLFLWVCKNIKRAFWKEELVKKW